MFRSMLLLALICIANPAIAWTGHDVQWHWVQRGDFNYLMPPAECRIGWLPPYRVVMLSQAAMDVRFMNPRYQHEFGHSFVDPDTGDGLIFLAKGLPPMVEHDILAHELAHVRGCTHHAFD